MEGFAGVLRLDGNGAPLWKSGRDYLRNMAVVEAIYRSHDTGQRMEID